MDKDNKVSVANSESEKLKKFYEEQIQGLKRNCEREFNELQLSMAREHEEMHALFSAATVECIELKDRYVKLDLKFKEYYMRSDNHIKH